MPSLVEMICETFASNSDTQGQRITQIIKEYKDTVDEIDDLNSPAIDQVNVWHPNATYTILHHLIARGHIMQAIKLISLGAEAHCISSFDGNRGLTIDIGDFAFHLSNSNVISEVSAREIMAFMLANMYVFKHDVQHRSIYDVSKVLATQRSGRLKPEVVEETESQREAARKEYSTLARFSALLARNFYVVEQQKDAPSWMDLCPEMASLESEWYASKYVFEPEVIKHWQAISNYLPPDLTLKFRNI